jgi:hypothetical protein
MLAPISVLSILIDDFFFVLLFHFDWSLKYYSVPNLNIFANSINIHL